MDENWCEEYLIYFDNSVCVWFITVKITNQLDINPYSAGIDFRCQNLTPHWKSQIFKMAVDS